MADAGLSSDRRGIFEYTGKTWLALGPLASRTTGSKPNLGGAQIRFADKKSMLVGNYDGDGQNYQVLFGKIRALGRRLSTECVSPEKGHRINLQNLV